MVEKNGKRIVKKGNSSLISSFTFENLYCRPNGLESVMTLQRVQLWNQPHHSYYYVPIKMSFQRQREKDRENKSGVIMGPKYGPNHLR